MPPYEVIIAGAMLVALTFYVLTGGADYGGGVWDLLASGPRAKEQRDLIAGAIGPIWEANHVWLIIAIVLLFACFPHAFATISVSLHIPIVLMLVGIVMRGSAFIFRSYGKGGGREQAAWGRMFGIESAITPIFIGNIIGAISSGNIEIVRNNFAKTFIVSWLAPFPISVGLFALSMFAFLAAVYLAMEAKDPLLKQDFRMRALASSVVLALWTLVVFLLAGKGAPAIREALVEQQWAWPLYIGTGASAILAFVSLWQNKFRMAVICAAAEVTLLIWGWAFAQYPFLVRPTLTLFNCAAPVVTLKLVLCALVAGGILIFPSFYYLLKIFKGAKLNKTANRG